MLTRALAYASRPYIRRELPGWGRILRSLIKGKDNTHPAWRGAPTRRTTNKRTGQLMELSLGDDIERATYFLGRYYDIEIQLLLDEILQPGDTGIDVGANIGNFSLYAAHRVGKTGRVISFEPQPECCARLRRQLEINGIENVEIHNVGLGNAPDTLTLHILGGGSIMAAIAIDEKVDVNVRKTIEIPVARGDDLLPDDLPGQVLLKIDVEGFELYALQGLVDAIERWQPAILLEVERRYLVRAGTSVEELFDFMFGKGYSVFDVEDDYSRATGHRLTLTPIADVAAYDRIEGTPDLLWLPQTGVWHDRVGRFITDR